MQSPPGPRGEPVFGDGRRYADDPLAFVSALESSYGDVSRFQMGPMETVLLCAPAEIERVLVSEADTYRKPDFVGTSLGELLGEGLLVSEGETWERQRDVAAPAFSMRRLAGVADRITGHAEERVATWEPGEVVDVEREMTHVTLDVIVDLLFGVELTDGQVETVRAALEPLGARFEPDPVRFAAPEWLPLPGDREFDRAVETLDGVVDDVVAARRGDVSEDDEDLLARLLRARERGEQTDAQLRDELVTALLAGHDTTALTLTYTLALLADHPGAAARAREEVAAVAGEERPGMARVRAFEYLEWVSREAMRLYPPVYAIFREPTEDVRLVGYDVPAGTSVMLPQWAVHRSERFWDDPGVFRPERFRPGAAAERPRFAYFPFGGGPRICIGQHLAMLEAQLILATVLDRYELAHAGDGDFGLVPSLTVHPADGMPMRVRERSENA